MKIIKKRERKITKSKYKILSAQAKRTHNLPRELFLF